MTVVLQKVPISSAPLPLNALTGPDPKSSPLPAGRDPLKADSSAILGENKSSLRFDKPQAIPVRANGPRVIRPIFRYGESNRRFSPSFVNRQTASRKARSGPSQSRQDKENALTPLVLGTV